MKKKLYCIELKNGSIINWETPLKGFKDDVEEYAKNKFKDFKKLIRVKPESVKPELSEEKIEEFEIPIDEYFENILSSSIMTLQDFNLKGHIVKPEKFRTVGIITESDTFFSQKIRKYPSGQLTKFVKISKEKHFKGHDFDFIILDNYFNKRHELLDFWAKLSNK